MLTKSFPSIHFLSFVIDMLRYLKTFFQCGHIPKPSHDRIIVVAHTIWPWWGTKIFSKNQKVCTNPCLTHNMHALWLLISRADCTDSCQKERKWRKQSLDFRSWLLSLSREWWSFGCSYSILCYNLWMDWFKELSRLLIKTHLHQLKSHSHLQFTVLSHHSILE